MRPIRALLSACFLLLATQAFALQPAEMLADPVKEARAREISADLRCLVCQNQSIDDSDAQLARDLRAIVRERIMAGDSNDQVRAWVVARYGDFILLKPPLKASTILLWAAPATLLVLGGFAVLLAFRKRRANGSLVAVPALTPDEEARLARKLDGSSES